MLNNKLKEKKKKSKQLNIVNIDLALPQEKPLTKEKPLTQEKPLTKEEPQTINKIDLLYLANQNQYLKTNKLEQLLSNNSLLKDLYDNIEENINTFKEQIINYNTITLAKLIENNDKIISGEKYKVYYLLYILNLILYLKEKKIKNIIKDELKDYTNASNLGNDASLNDFNIHNETINTMCSKKQITNLDMFVIRKSVKNNIKILPQRRE